jgi:hypothetical protein
MQPNQHSEGGPTVCGGPRVAAHRDGVRRGDLPAGFFDLSLRLANNGVFDAEFDERRRQGGLPGPFVPQPSGGSGVRYRRFPHNWMSSKFQPLYG